MTSLLLDKFEEPLPIVEAIINKKKPTNENIPINRAITLADELSQGMKRDNNKVKLKTIKIIEKIPSPKKLVL